MIHAAAKGVIAFLTIVSDGDHTPYYPQVYADLGVVSRIEVPSLAEGVWWPKKEYMQGWLIEPEANYILATIDYAPHVEDNLVLSLFPYDPLDQNFDTYINGDDYDLFVKNFELGLVEADFNGDGWLTGDDYDLFMDYWNK